MSEDNQIKMAKDMQEKTWRKKLFKREKNSVFECTIRMFLKEIFQSDF